jgi:hypothetical protein
MNVEAVDDAIDRYIHERLEKGKRYAVERFLSYVYMTHGGEELRRFLHDVAKLSSYYIDYLKVTENPLKGPELPWLAAMLAVGGFSICLLFIEDYRILGVVLLSGTLVNGWALLSASLRKWREIEVMIAIYREVSDLATREEESTPPG